MSCGWRVDQEGFCQSYASRRRNLWIEVGSSSNRKASIKTRERISATTPGTCGPNPGFYPMVWTKGTWHPKDMNGKISSWNPGYNRSHLSWAIGTTIRRKSSFWLLRCVTGNLAKTLTLEKSSFLLVERISRFLSLLESTAPPMHCLFWISGSTLL